MTVEKIYKISNWTSWNHTLNEATYDFYNIYFLKPNILEANEHTFSQFDFLVNEMPHEKENVSNIEDLSSSSKDNYIELSSFTNDLTNLEFAIDDNIGDKEFRLVYDFDPNWGDDEEDFKDLPVNDKDLVLKNQKIYLS